MHTYALYMPIVCKENPAIHTRSENKSRNIHVTFHVICHVISSDLEIPEMRSVHQIWIN